MNKLKLFLFIVLSPLLFLQSTCSPETQPKTETPTVVDDKSTLPSDCYNAAKVSNKGCPENYDPVCGCDEKTYPNACEASSKGILKWEKGVCAKDCIDESKITNNPCTKNYNPVCGCNNQTYSNSCLARNAGLVHWTPGACSDGCIDKTKIKRRACPDVYDPVCGCNGVTYTNSCNAEIRGVVRWEKGKCPDDKSGKSDGCIDPSKISLRSCPDVYDPVCGCNGKTYPNECSAQVSGLVRYTKGPCSQDKNCVDKTGVRPRPCPEEYIPVCGCDGNDYPSPCEAENAGVKKYALGKCSEMDKNCIDINKVKMGSACPDIYAPVCGCNGKTYNNKCVAGNAGLKSWKEGPCPK